jgi:hypothetical protein
VGLSQTKHYKICIYCFSAKQATLRNKSKDWLGKTLLTILWIFRHLTKGHIVKGIKLFISGLTFTRGNDQPFRSNVIAFLFSLRADIQTFN